MLMIRGQHELAVAPELLRGVPKRAPNLLHCNQRGCQRHHRAVRHGELRAHGGAGEARVVHGHFRAASSTSGVGRKCTANPAAVKAGRLQIGPKSVDFRSMHYTLERPRGAQTLGTVP